MIDNFDKIAKLLVFDSEDDFYFLQILKRKKENPEIGSNTIVVRHYYIKSVEQLIKLKKEIVLLCQYHNARAGLCLNRRSFEKISFQLLKKVSDQIMNKDYYSVQNAYASVVGAYSHEPNSKWIIDIDVKNNRFINEVMRFIDGIKQPEGNKFIASLETKNGFHLITKPFNLKTFKDQYPDIEVQKDNPTNLYNI